MSDADLTGRTLGGFKVLRKLGSGGMAAVYKAHEGSLNRVVALKVIHEHLAKQAEFVERFHREARAAAQLSHPNIVQIYAIGDENGMPFFSMEYVKGTSLQAIIENEGFLTARRAAPILSQAAQALAAAHEAGIVHRDIKPSNIMLDAAARVKVADFGIAQVAAENRLTQTGMMLGTPGYTSPEQCLGERLDARSDIYSLGVTAYEMLSGNSPYRADTPAALVLQIVDGVPPPLAEVNPSVPSDLQRIVEKMMQKNPAERFQNAEDVVAALAHADLDETVSGGRAVIERTRIQRASAAPAAAAASAPAEATRLKHRTSPSPPPSAPSPPPSAPSSPPQPSPALQREATRSKSALQPVLMVALALVFGAAVAGGVLFGTGLVEFPGKAKSTAETASAAEPAAETATATEAAAGAVNAAVVGDETAGATEPAAETGGVTEPAAGAASAAVVGDETANTAEPAAGTASVTEAAAGTASAAEAEAGTTDTGKAAIETANATAPSAETASASERAPAARDASLPAAAGASKAEAPASGVISVAAATGAAANRAAATGATTATGATSSSGAERLADRASAAASGAGTAASGAGTAASGTTAIPSAAAPRGIADAQAVRTAPQKSAAAPAAKSVITVTAGDYAHVDLVKAGVEQALSRSGFEIVDLLPAGQTAREAAHFRILSTVKLVGSRQLEYYGRTQTLETVELSVQATDLGTGVRAAGPFTTTVDYTPINLASKLEQGADKIAAELARDLDERLGNGR